VATSEHQFAEAKLDAATARKLGTISTQINDVMGL
jgi:hypothetical protein